MENDKLS